MIVPYSYRNQQLTLIRYLDKQAAVARSLSDVAQEKTANTSMARVRSMIEQGVTVEQAKVIQALLGALDNANSRSKPKRCVYVPSLPICIYIYMYINVYVYQLELRPFFILFFALLA